MKKQRGFGLIGVLLIIGALVLTAGGVTGWRKKTNPNPSPMPTPTPSISLTPTDEPSSTPLTIGSEEYCHQFRFDNCPAECQVGPSCPICQDEGCHAKGAHQVQTTLISCRTDRDCPSSLGCWPLSKQCLTWKCVNAQCFQVDDEDTLKELTDSMQCQKDQDCAYLCRGSKAVIDYSQPFSWCVNRDYLKAHLVACLDVYVPPLGTCQCLNERCQLIPN